MNALTFLAAWFVSAGLVFVLWYAIDTRLDNAAAARRARTEREARRALARLTEETESRTYWHGGPR